ncbi:DUF2461 domain-containing protein [Membranihabitans marinus]|uniref:DUF2461 domain-containing protein n=1 Tax=Membranihabitans marinus TaxID=1227546 RepID=UPI001F2D7097|nr:DUF2461 domain-containing protein [Membranihabitans marinus]
MNSTLQTSTLEFLQDLSMNNNREWFQANKSQYEVALDNFKSFVKSVELALQEKDVIEKTKVFRIYRDVRFSKDKTPYKTNFSAGFTRAGKHRRGGYYLMLEPGQFHVAGGFWNPESKDLQYIREGIARDAEDLKAAINDENFVKRFSSLAGDELKSSPRGYSKDHPEVNLLRKKQFLVSQNFTIADSIQPDFKNEVVDCFISMIPMFDAIRDMLLYDGNGEERM